MMLIFLVYIIQPEASAKICVYVFTLKRVFIRIYFWILFTRSEELWLFPLHMNLIWGQKKKHSNTGPEFFLPSYQNLFRNQTLSLRGNLKINKNWSIEVLHTTAAACFLPCGGFRCDLSRFVRLFLFVLRTSTWPQSHCAARPSSFFEVRYYSQDYCKYWSLYICVLYILMEGI